MVEAEPAMAATADGLHFSLSAFDLIFRKSIQRCERLRNCVWLRCVTESSLAPNSELKKIKIKINSVLKILNFKF